MGIKTIRKISGLSQEAFSKKYEIPKRTLESWEMGERQPAPYVLKLLDRVVKEDSMIEYFKNVKYEVNAVQMFDELELVIPEGFNYSLNSIEKSKLLHDQLLHKGLCTSGLTIDGTFRVVTAGEKAKFLAEETDISKRLKYYLQLMQK